jgi:hypothetical protein
MFKITKTYTDYNGDEKTEDFWFNLDKVELSEIALGPSGGLDALIERVINTNDSATIIATFKDIILKAYGERTPDGRFAKVDDFGHPLSVKFSQTAVFPELFMEIAFDAEKAAEFINGCVPTEMTAQTTETTKEALDKLKGGAPVSSTLAEMNARQRAVQMSHAKPINPAES